MKVRYTDESIAEVSDILDYIAKDNSARRVAVAIQETSDFITETAVDVSNRVA
jgi:hypothetical protein